jgi:hypothetical protein
MNNFIKSFCLLFATIAVASPDLNLDKNESNFTPRKEQYVFGSVSLVPGVGFSSRTFNDRSDSATALDIKFGYLHDFPFGGKMPVVSWDYNYLEFSATHRGYFSFGFGTAYIVPYIPLRAGLQFKHGFIDIGGKLILGFIPMPEARGGFQISF